MFRHGGVQSSSLMRNTDLQVVSSFTCATAPIGTQCSRFFHGSRNWLSYSRKLCKDYIQPFPLELCWPPIRQHSIYGAVYTSRSSMLHCRLVSFSESKISGQCSFCLVVSMQCQSLLSPEHVTSIFLHIRIDISMPKAQGSRPGLILFCGSNLSRTSF